MSPDILTLEGSDKYKEFSITNTHVAGMCPALDTVRAQELTSRRNETDHSDVPLLLAGDTNGVQQEAQAVFDSLNFKSAYDHPNSMAIGGPTVTAHNDK